MNDARSLIAAFNYLNKSTDKTIAHFTPSLIGMFGSTNIFESFLQEVDSAICAGEIPGSLKKRAANLIGTFIPQVAEYNNLKNTSTLSVTADELRGIAANTLENRRKGVEIILLALTTILKETEQIS